MSNELMSNERKTQKIKQSKTSNLILINFQTSCFITHLSAIFKPAASLCRLFQNDPATKARLVPILANIGIKFKIGNLGRQSV